MGDTYQTENFNICLNSFAGIFHYAPSCFEGLKAFRGVDGRIRLFRPDKNAKRMADSATYLDMPYPSEEMFINMCVQCVKENLEYLPPYEASGASLYLRPALIGINPQLGIHSARDVMFAVMCSPVGTYSGSEESDSWHRCYFEELRPRLHFRFWMLQARRKLCAVASRL